jgi:hypothetical protein
LHAPAIGQGLSQCRQEYAARVRVKPRAEKTEEGAYGDDDPAIKNALESPDVSLRCKPGRVDPLIYSNIF